MIQSVFDNEINVITAIIISLLLSLHGLRKKSLDVSGAISAALIGFITFSSSIRFGMTLILFYYTSSKLTKWKEQYKMKLESDFLPGGRRNFLQVFANSILATLVCVIYKLVENKYVIINSSNREMLCSRLLNIFVAHYACACGDTWASEVGILSPHPPRLITSLFQRSVPRGTNGGMSLLGTIASGLGGLFIGFIFYIFSYDYSQTDVWNIYNILQSIINTTHNNNDNTSNNNMITNDMNYSILLIGLISGLLGSIYDSLLGATLQCTYYSKNKKCIIKSIDSQRLIKKNDDNDDDIILISGLNVLSNEAVNFISILFTMITIYYLVPIG